MIPTCIWNCGSIRLIVGVLVFMQQRFDQVEDIFVEPKDIHRRMHDYKIPVIPINDAACEKQPGKNKLLCNNNFHIKPLRTGK